MNDDGGQRVVISGTIAAVILVAVVGSIYYWQPESVRKVDTLLDIPRAKILVTEGVERWYTNDSRTFSFRLPDGYLAPEFKTDIEGVWGVHVDNGSGSKLRIIVTPIEIGVPVGAEQIASALDGVEVTNMKERFIATVVRGISFSTNEEEWGGNGIGFWAANNGYLYQMYAAKTDQDLMDFVIANWYFAPPVPGVNVR